MDMKKRMVFFLIATLVALLLAGCGSAITSPSDSEDAGAAESSGDAGAAESEGDAGAAESSGAAGTAETSGDAVNTEDLGPPVTVNLGHSMSTEDYRGKAADYFAQIVDEKSGGNIKITVYPSETLTVAQDNVKLVGGGVAEMGAGSLSYAVSLLPALAPLDIPGAYDPKHFRETYEAIRPIIDEILAEQNVKLMIMFDETDSVFYLNKNHMRDVHTPEDIANLRIRDSGKWVGEAISAWGANPMTIVPGELTVAIERGTVDGGFTGWGFVNAFRLYEAAPAVTFTNLSKSVWSPILVNLDFWNGLTPAQQQLLTESALETELYSDELLQSDYEQFLKNIESVNGTIYEMTPEETDAFMKLTEPLIDKARAETGELGNKLIDTMLETKAQWES
jgi:C4-dicarboxylate-binding protein DctP